MTEPDAMKACKALGEMLWYADESHGSFFKYLAYEGMDGPFWIARRQGPICKDIIANGKMGLEHCPNLLPAICTQSAPLSNSTYADNSTKW